MAVRAPSALLAAAALVAVAVPASGAQSSRPAAPPRITTMMSNAKGVLTLVATGPFLTLSMQVAGTEHWFAGAQPQAAPLTASPVSVHFGKLNVVRVTFPFHRGATAELTYTVQGTSVDGVGGSGDATCYGAAVVFDGGSISDHPC